MGRGRRKRETEGKGTRVNLHGCSISRLDVPAVIRRIFKVLLTAAPLYPLSRNKESARFFREVAGVRGGTEETDYVLDLWKAEGEEELRGTSRGRGIAGRKEGKERKFSGPHEAFGVKEFSCSVFLPVFLSFFPSFFAVFPLSFFFFFAECVACGCNGFEVPCLNSGSMKPLFDLMLLEMRNNGKGYFFLKSTCIRCTVRAVNGVTPFE